MKTGFSCIRVKKKVAEFHAFVEDEKIDRQGRELFKLNKNVPEQKIEAHECFFSFLGRARAWISLSLREQEPG